MATTETGAGAAGRTARTPRDATPEEVAAVLARPDARFVVASHHNPDGDAIGCMLAVARALRARGRDVVLAHPDPDPVPGDLSFLLRDGERIEPRMPADAPERILIAVDCASERRLWPDDHHEEAGLVVNVDHHQDNTRFGDLNLIDGRASSTAEVIAGVLRVAGWPPSQEVAEALYAGLVTDTGRFGYSNTRADSHRLAAELIEAGVDPAEMARHLFEEQPLDRLLLMGRALERARPLAGGRLLASLLTRDDFAAAGGDDTEGIVEVMRSVRGVEVAALAREAGPPGSLRVSLRAADEEVDVSVIAREEGGGGHRAAAGFSTRRPPEELLAWLDRRVAERLDGGG